MKQNPTAARAASLVAIAFVAILLAVHFVHPRADFPNFSPWMDYAKYTDEGWYGNAAIAYFVRGGWYVPGDFNPAVALPVWPFLEWILFHFTGVSLMSARILAVAIFVGSVALTYLLVKTEAPRWAALLAAVIAASNAFLYCFSRLAILEPLLIFLGLLSWLLALLLPRTRSSRQRITVLVAIGILLCLMVLTKTTAIFLFPAVAYLLWRSQRHDRRSLFSAVTLVGLAAAIPWGLYYFFLVRPHYLDDYHYLFTANVYPQPTTASGWFMALWYAVHGTSWVDPKLVTVTTGLVVLSVFLFRSVWRSPLFVASFLASASYLGFIGFHNNMQPRYYQVVAFPLIIMTVLALHRLASGLDWARRALTAIAALGIAVSLFINTHETLWFAFHPQYTFVNAAEGLTRYVDQHPNRNRLLLSISGSDIALITGLPAICDDFGTLDLPARIRKYQPGWYAAWNELDPGTLEDLQTQFRLTEVANFPAYDDEDRNDLILYKLTPLKDSDAKRRF
ncbi:hypothetical protein ACPOL_3846 [Acidisarcina polymorpha]|uniref:Glycosyltransferase RgtA/B/C/D-like domain-containing protein n=1 Tax=Acidisarcina polymorpha TaxID=2211140 RepID=A0A2Z5G3C3_9BACT|nr:glycosyltransferase family 39 protein [Acidisarcina polymorpha]AXC13125.1 hypothetical protein ACPOL_3846 [Acidisarcina polymorpha]